MKLSADVGAQLRMLVTAMSAGGGLGLFRDVLSLLPGGRRGGLFLLREMIFAAAAFRLLFFVGLRSGQGLGPEMICAALAGLLFYYGILHSAFSFVRNRISSFCIQQKSRRQ